jgi:hypothetical protein
LVSYISKEKEATWGYVWISGGKFRRVSAWTLSATHFYLRVFTHNLLSGSGDHLPEDRRSQTKRNLNDQKEALFSLRNGANARGNTTQAAVEGSADTGWGSVERRRRPRYTDPSA